MPLNTRKLASLAIMSEGKFHILLGGSVLYNLIELVTFARCMFYIALHKKKYHIGWIFRYTEIFMARCMAQNIYQPTYCTYMYLYMSILENATALGRAKTSST